MKATARRAKLEREVVSWAAQAVNRELMHDVPAAEIRVALREGHLLSGPTLVNLRFLGLWHGCQAVALQARGADATGESYSAHCAALAEVRLGKRLFDGDGHSKRSFRLWRSGTALHCARAYASQLRDDAAEMVETLRSGWTSGLFNPEPSFVATFLLTLLGPCFGVDAATLNLPEMPVTYAALAASARAADATAVGEYLADASDARTTIALGGLSASGVRELGDMLYAAYPAELLCVLRVREELGLEPPPEIQRARLGPMWRIQDCRGAPLEQPILSAVLREL